MAMYHSIFTVILFAFFIGIVWWAYGKSRKKDFEQAAQLPFADEDQNPGNDKNINGGQS